VKQSRYARLVGSYSVEALETFPAIRSIVLYGSVSRGVANRDSDVDLLVLMESDESVGERIQRLSQIENSGRTRQELDWLDSHEIYTHISTLPLTRDEAAHLPPILLDVLEDGVPIVDDGTFHDIRSVLRARLVEAGAKRVFLSPNEWYWDLAPGLVCTDCEGTRAEAMLQRGEYASETVCGGFRASSRNVHESFAYALLVNLCLD